MKWLLISTILGIIALMLTVTILASSIVFELAAIFMPADFRKLLSPIVMLLHFTVVGYFLSSGEISSSLYMLFIGVFRFVNILRLSRPRMHPKELKTRSLRTWVFLSFLSLLALLDFSISIDAAVTVLSLLALVASAALAASVFASRYLYRLEDDDKSISNPSVTICIPARNETQDLPACIESALASSYVKLEIIVLDDCSHDKTPEIIKKYAHQGVRFIRGQEPGDKWLAKNAAYDKLLEEAKGEVVLYIGVDVRLKNETVTALVNQLGSRQMISVLPRRSRETESSFFIQPLRYWWELGLWRFWGSHPPVLSTCWMARSEFLRENGGFEAYRRSIKPEAQIARQARQVGGYRFIIANDEMGLTSNKSPQAQLDTALRVRYPQLRRRPEATMVLVSSLALVGIFPVVSLVYSLSNSNLITTLISFAAMVLLSFANVMISRIVLHHLWFVSIVNAPALAFIDGYIALRSMFSYELGNVSWKDRNVCLPLLQVEKELPSLQERKL